MEGEGMTERIGSETRMYLKRNQKKKVKK